MLGTHKRKSKFDVVKETRIVREKSHRNSEKVKGSRLSKDIKNKQDFDERQGKQKVFEKPKCLNDIDTQNDFRPVKGALLDELLDLFHSEDSSNKNDSDTGKSDSDKSNGQLNEINRNITQSIRINKDLQLFLAAAPIQDKHEISQKELDDSVESLSDNLSDSSSISHRSECFHEEVPRSQSVSNSTLHFKGVDFQESLFSEMRHERPFDFHSFNRPLPCLDISTSPDESFILNPLGFSSYRTNGESCVEVKNLLDRLPQSPISWLDRHNKENQIDTSSSSLKSKVLDLWRRNIQPGLVEEDRLWKPYYDESTQQPDPNHYSTFFRLIASYVDVYYAEEMFSTSAWIRALTVLHIVDHLLKTREVLAKNNELLKELIASRQVMEGKSAVKRNVKTIQRGNKKKKILASVSKVVGLGNENYDQRKEDVYLLNERTCYEEDEFRDQGFTQPRVLWLTPMRHMAKCMVDMLLALLPRNKQIRHHKRFEKEFSVQYEHEGSQKTPSAEELAKDLLNQDKSPDYAELFRGNNCDLFRLGIRLHSSGVTLYAPFYKSDIIVASPLGLHLIIGSPGCERCEYDFLSSIEIVVVDRADVLCMQNWNHVEEIFQVLNVKPQKWRSECDIRRLRFSYSEGHARRFRQSILLSYKRFPEALGLFYSTTSPVCHNFRGLVKLFRSSSGLVAKQANLQVAKQIFMNIPCSSINTLYESLLNFLQTQFPPSFLAPLNSHEATGGRLLFVVPTYIEYLLVRKVFKTFPHIANDSRNFTCFRACHEYSSNRMLSRSRHMLLTGQVNLLITTERFLFYRHYLLKGADHVVFFRPLYYPSIYLLCINALNNPCRAIALTLFTRFDALLIEKYFFSYRTKTLCDLTSDIPKVFVLNN